MIFNLRAFDIITARKISWKYGLANYLLIPDFIVGVRHGADWLFWFNPYFAFYHFLKWTNSSLMANESYIHPSVYVRSFRGHKVGLKKLGWRAISI